MRARSGDEVGWVRWDGWHRIQSSQANKSDLYRHAPNHITQVTEVTRSIPAPNPMAAGRLVASKAKADS